MKKKQNNVEIKITNLKKKLKLLQENFAVETYKTLNQIFELRKKDNPKFNLVKLHKEVEDILTWDQVYFYMQLAHISEKTWKLINKGKISATVLARVLYKSKEFRDENVQLDFCEKYIAGKIRYRDIMFSDSNFLLSKVKQTLDYKNIPILRTVHQLTSLNNDLNKYKHLLSKEDKIKLMRKCETLKKIIVKDKTIKEIAISSSNYKKFALIQKNLRESVDVTFSLICDYYIKNHFKKQRK